MTPTELHAALAALGLRPRDLAGLVDVSDRAVSLWLAGGREIPGPLAAYVGLLLNLPTALRSQELARLKEKDTKAMVDGMYRVDLQGRTGDGLGCIVAQRGRIFGSDGMVEFDGEYEPTGVPGEADVRLTVTVPPGTPLIQGVGAGIGGMRYDVEKRINFASGQPFALATPLGAPPHNQVMVRLTKLRGLPE